MATVIDGDCILSIAKALGIRDYQTLWDANGTLKATRPNPNMLVEGDTVVEPPKTKKEVRKTGKRWTFVVPDEQKASLHIVLLGADAKPLAEAVWALSEPLTANGTTGADGAIKVDNLPVDKKKGVLKVTPKAAASTPATTTTTTSTSGPPPYPAPIKAADFKDPVRAADPSDAFVEWELKIGSLPSHKHESGVLARLHNLGAGCDAGDNGARTAISVKAYQRAFLNQSAPSGAPADIQDSIRDRHDKKT
ncbi:MAG: hypothetical protein HYX27_07070 [Acidobacteria bacterium]|nr:hypothetical protein [Acidobacteriota bacterium]